MPAAGGWEWKDAEVLDERIREGRYTVEQVEETWAEGRRVVAELDAGRRWWDPGLGSLGARPGVALPGMTVSRTSGIRHAHERVTPS